jgi:hypothetical protein
MQIEQSHRFDPRARTFGRKALVVVAAPAPRSNFVDDLKLFALTFAGGFLFVSLYLA